MSKRRKMNKRITSIILMFCFVITLAVPTATVQAATNYSKVNKTYSIGNINNIKTEYTGSTDKLEKGYTNVYKFYTPGQNPVYFSFISSDKGDYDVCLTNKSGKKIFEKKNASKKFSKCYNLAKGTYYVKIKANKKSLYQIRLDWSTERVRVGKVGNTFANFYAIVDIGDYTIKKGDSKKLNPGIGTVSWKLGVTQNDGTISWKLGDNKYVSLSTSKGKTCTVTGLKTGIATIMVKYKGIYLRYFIEVEDEADASSSEFIVYDTSMTHYSDYYYIYGIWYYNNSDKSVKRIEFNLYNGDDLNDEDASDIYKKTVTKNILISPYESICDKDIVLEDCEELGDSYAVIKDVTVTYTDGTTKTVECNAEIEIDQPLHWE
jgi:hypothetical protein